MTDFGQIPATAGVSIKERDALLRNRRPEISSASFLNHDIIPLLCNAASLMVREPRDAVTVLDRSHHEHILTHFESVFDVRLTASAWTCISEY